MHFCYLDEAGCTGADLANQEQPIFVLGGISVSDEKWIKTQKALAAIIDGYFSGELPQNFELHAEQLLSPSGSGPFLGHNRDLRNKLAKDILSLLTDRSHSIHLFAVDKKKLGETSCNVSVPYNVKVPYLLSYDYLITYINWFVKNRLGRTARRMLIIDVKDQFQSDIECITRIRRFDGPAAHRINRIVEFSYPVDSLKNPMVQLSDLVVFCAKKFLEIDNEYRPGYTPEAKKFYAECYLLIHDQLPRKEIVDREGRNMDEINIFLKGIQSKPVGLWKRRYGI